MRELAHSVERLLLLGEDGEADAADLPVPARVIDATAFRLPPEGLDWEALERDLLQQSLTQVQGNRTRAAKLLNLPYKAFLYRIEKHGLGGSECMRICPNRERGPHLGKFGYFCRHLGDCERSERAGPKPERAVRVKPGSILIFVAICTATSNWITAGIRTLPFGPSATQMFASASCLRSPASAGMTSKKYVLTAGTRIAVVFTGIHPRSMTS